MTAVLEGMKRHAEDAKVQESGCWALLNLMKTVVGNNQSGVVKAEVKKVVEEAMQRHDGVPEMQKTATACLRVIQGIREE